MGPRLESMELSHEQVTQLFQLAKARRVTDLDEPTVTMLQDELPTELKMCQDELLRAEAMLPTARSMLKVLASIGDATPAEALAPLARAAQLVGVHLPETELHFVAQLAVGCVHSEDSASHRDLGEQATGR